jgi:hypothetical protein
MNETQPIEPGSVNPSTGMLKTAELMYTEEEKRGTGASEGAKVVLTVSALIFSAGTIFTKNSVGFTLMHIPICFAFFAVFIVLRMRTVSDALVPTLIQEDVERDGVAQERELIADLVNCVRHNKPQIDLFLKLYGCARAYLALSVVAIMAILPYEINKPTKPNKDIAELTESIKNSGLCLENLKHLGQLDSITQLADSLIQLNAKSKEDNDTIQKSIVSLENRLVQLQMQFTRIDKETKK